MPILAVECLRPRVCKPSVLDADNSQSDGKEKNPLRSLSRAWQQLTAVKYSGAVPRGGGRGRCQIAADVVLSMGLLTTYT